ncbi:MAG: ankyrin repeat domain-containing protein [Candidatus Firestonebacteria bacterium]|nr:ankyrin repeat domain-containing protein [Candidatus Firestonebacteria bacterium]
MHRAAKEGDKKFIGLLISKGADINANTNDDKEQLLCIMQ